MNMRLPNHSTEEKAEDSPVSSFFIQDSRLLRCSRRLPVVSLDFVDPLLNLLNPGSHTQGQTHFEGKGINI